MAFEHLVNHTGEWLKGKGPDSDVVISSRVRLARNVEDFFFVEKMSFNQREEFLDNVNTVCKKFTGFDFILMEKLSPLDRKLLLERHLISADQMNHPRGKAVLLRADEISSVMFNEEDHLRIQVLKSGFDLKKAWKIANDLEETFAKNFKFAFSSQFGYLTACPTNVGTGMRSSCMLHLPGLIMTKKINKILELLAKLSFTARGFFGEGTQAIGNFFQISNQITLGTEEEEILGNLSSIVKQIKMQELSAREYLVSKYRRSLEDKIWRALGALKSARLISSEETLSHLSLLRLGSDLGIIKNLERQVLNNLFIIIQPAHLQKSQRRELSHKERDFIRSSILREKLIGIQI